MLFLFHDGVWNPWLPVGYDVDRMFRSKFFVCKCPGDTINCQTPGTPGLIVYQMPGVCQEGMLVAGIDSHITLTYPVSTRWPSVPCPVKPVQAVGHCVSSHPLSRVLSALCTDLRDPYRSPEIGFQPLVMIVMLGNPRAIPDSCLLSLEPGECWCTVLVVDGWSCELVGSKTAALHSQGGVTSRGWWGRAILN